ncbi:unnamed protein product [Mytilus edulis]|uniref:C-type lectin domain-containing protein n=1 Tax=Mytilus edulis TaxID=6550 RepID=A0A8S3S8P7_MYTED|nr:unnamed protein product [Mytilus edulis]
MINSQYVHMFYSKRQHEGIMMKYNKLYLLMIVALLQISAYTAQFIPVQNPIDQQPDVILIDDRGSSETSFLDGPDVGTGSNFGLPTIPFLALALLVIPMVMMTMMSTTETSVAPMPVVPTTVSVTVPTPQAAVPTTQCVPTNCPANYRLLNDQTASSNCYFDSGTQSDLIWSDARKTCTDTAGAYLWRPNSRAEADAVKNTFDISNGEEVWTGGHSPTQDQNYVFADNMDNNAAFILFSIPFGELNPGDIGESCLHIDFDNGNNIWEWENEDCDDDERFVCEFPRVSMTKISIVNH